MRSRAWSAQARQLHRLCAHRLVASPFELALFAQAHPIAQGLHRHAQDLGRHRYRLPTLDQTHRLQLEFQGVFAPGLSVFSLAYIRSPITEFSHQPWSTFFGGKIKPQGQDPTAETTGGRTPLDMADSLGETYAQIQGELRAAVSQREAAMKSGVTSSPGIGTAQLPAPRVFNPLAGLAAPGPGLCDGGWVGALEVCVAHAAPLVQSLLPKLWPVLLTIAMDRLLGGASFSALPTPPSHAIPGGPPAPLPRLPGGLTL